MKMKLTALLLLLTLLLTACSTSGGETTPPTEVPPAFAVTIEGTVANDAPVSAKLPDGVGEVTPYQ